MAFQAGTQIRPELANADYSGFVNAANIRAQAMMNLGEQIGGGIREYQKNKEIKGELTGQIEGSLTADPSLLASLNQLNDVSASVKKMQEGNANKKDLLMIHGAIGSIQNIKDRQRQAEAQEVERKIKLAQLKELEAGRGTGVNLQSPKAYKTSDGQIVYGAFDPSSNQVLEVGTDRKLPPGSLPFSENGSSAEGQMMTLDQLNQLRDEGMDYTATPTGDGNYRVTQISPFSQQKGDADAIYMEGALKSAGEAFGTAITKWQNGESFQARKNLRSVNNAFEALASGSADTRTFFDFGPDIGGFREAARAFFNPTGQDAYDNVVSVVATTLKEALGGAFTEKEGTRILNASYNPQLSTEQNLQRLAGISATISATIDAKDAQAEAFFAGKDWRSLPSPKEIFETNLAIYENVLQDKDRSIGIPATGSNVPATRIKSIKTGK